MFSAVSNATVLTLLNFFLSFDQCRSASKAKYCYSPVSAPGVLIVRISVQVKKPGEEDPDCCEQGNFVAKKKKRIRYAAGNERCFRKFPSEVISRPYGRSRGDQIQQPEWGELSEQESGGEA